MSQPSSPAPWVRRARRQRRWRAVSRVVLLLVLAAVIYVVVTFVQVVLAANEDQAEDASAEAIVVLGAAQYDGRPSSVLQARLDHAADLYARGVAPVVVVTGGRQPGDRFTEARAADRYLQSKGVPESALRLEIHGENSWQSLAAAALILEQEQIDDVILVSSPYHALRTRHIAAEVGLNGVSSPAAEAAADSPEAIGRYAEETVAVAAGRLVGYRRLVNLDDRVERVREPSTTG